MPSSALAFHLTPTLFPYTTLFRSGRRAGLRAGHVRGQSPGRLDGARDPERVVLPVPATARWVTPGSEAACFAFGRLGPVHEWPIHSDRKSTRLNSSHANISYAVFCSRVPPDTYTLSLHDALPIWTARRPSSRACSWPESRATRWSPRSRTGRTACSGHRAVGHARVGSCLFGIRASRTRTRVANTLRSEEHTSELQSRQYLVCRLLLSRST